MLKEEIIESAESTDLPISEEPTEQAEAPVDSENSQDTTDYAAIAKSDTEYLREHFAELSDIKDISELENPLRYAALRDLGLTPEEAYLATTRKRRTDNRSHLYASVPRHSAPPVSAMTERELIEARELFPNASDAQIRKLYKKVTG